jgi:RNA polymerase sigma-70 factor (ECF subfamily)
VATFLGVLGRIFRGRGTVVPEMRSDSQPVSLTELLAHSDWVQRLARRLASDGGMAEDLVQSTWLEALRRPPLVRGDLRAWLGQVLRNQARQLRRGAHRRQERERARANAEATDGAGEIVERAMQQRELADRVLALDEPFRTAILLRFFADLAPQEIASKLGVPVKTVHSRIARGLDRLRESLNRDHGGDGSWQRAFLPILGAFPPKPVSAAVSVLQPGGYLLKLKSPAMLALVFGALSASGLVWLLLGSTLDEPDAGRVELVDGGAKQSVATARLSDSEDEPLLDDRVALQGSIAPVDAAPAAVAEPTSRLVRGRVLDAHGQGVEGVEVRLSEAPGQVLATSAQNGRFELELEPVVAELVPERRLFAEGAGWLALRDCRIEPEDPQDGHLLVVAPAGKLAGQVVDADGAPIPTAVVSMDPAAVRLWGFPEVLDRTALRQRSARVESAGDFRFEAFPELPGMAIIATAPGFESRRLVLEEATLPLVVVLMRDSDRPGVRVTGVVLDSHATPVEGATVELAGAVTRSGPDGSFELMPSEVAPSTLLCASAPGQLPALIAHFGARLPADGRNPAPVELMLGGPPLEIVGHLVEADGKPCVGWSVRIQDETAISQYQVPIRSAEGLARAGQQIEQTDGAGQFKIPGLFGRSYRLLFFDEKTLRSHACELNAGQGTARIVLPESVRADLEGIVVDRDGRPVPGVEVTLALDVWKSALGSSSVSGASMRTALDGRFRFEGVSGERLHLTLTGESILPSQYRLGSGDLEQLEVLVVRRCHFRVEGPVGAAGEFRFRLFSAGGEPLQLNRFEAFGMSAFMEAALVEGRSETLSVSELATTLEVLRNGESLGVTAVVLQPGEVTTLRF